MLCKQLARLEMKVRVQASSEENVISMEKSYCNN